ncbi:MAG: nucleoside deaminase [Balneolaceae bacterium]|nr:nucleoside deaminase [Balneolaceae bacterium]
MMDKKFMQRAVKLARNGMKNNQGGPFGCVIVKNGKIIAEGNNSVTSENDPTAHAEIVAIRKACIELGSFQLTGCELYTSCEPCPMCLGAIYWARPDRVYFAATRNDAAEAGFDDEFIYNELDLSPEKRKIPMISLERELATDLFSEWVCKEDKMDY